ncbi:Mor transcription activator family protein [Paraclostridium sordellii]|uniref:Mor transcription activator family protein n=1 Tax=Paraclostridium sordellii TaxID=1505 RepID=UPI0005DE52AA|nr:Mor transcription activator family protein [Paeniclostridium sordellii]CEN77834.1 transcriptional regulator [[Clostridium] sordellii] [Paeniclostridium sordellii]
MFENLKIEDLPDSYKDVAEEIGIDSFKKLVKLLGGNSLYIPKEVSLTRPIRDRIIKEDFNGDYKILSRRYNISQSQIRNILDKQTKGV